MLTPWKPLKALTTSRNPKFMSPKTTKPSVEASAAACASVASTTRRSKSCLNLVLLAASLPGMCMPALLEPERVWLSPRTHLCGVGVEAPTRPKVATVKLRLFSYGKFRKRRRVASVSSYLFARLCTEGANGR